MKILIILVYVILKLDIKLGGFYHKSSTHRRMAYTAFWTKAPPGRKNNMPKGTVMVKKPILSIHIELNIIYPFPNNKY